MPVATQERTDNLRTELSDELEDVLALGVARMGASDVLEVLLKHAFGLLTDGRSKDNTRWAAQSLREMIGQYEAEKIG